MKIGLLNCLDYGDKEAAAAITTNDNDSSQMQ